MLKEEQAAELLTRCETIIGKKLSDVQGKLQQPDARSAIVWELLVIEAASQIGTVEYEPDPGGSPDIRLHLPQGRPIWLEVAFLYPRFWKEERKSEAVIQWIFQEVKQRAILPWKIQYRLDGDRKNTAGPIRALPDLHERKRFLKDSGISKFFEDICSAPDDQHLFSSSQYSIALSYTPNAREPYSSGGGLLQESPKTIKEHAVYKVLKDKAGQHKVNGPRVICIGSDQSPALSSLTGPGQPTVRDAVTAAFREHRSLSAAIVVRIETPFTSLPGQLDRQAHGNFYENTYARGLLTEQEAQALCKLDFNRWRYTYPLEKWERNNNEERKRVAGRLICSFRGGEMEIEVPANILVDALAGKTSLVEAYGLSEDDPIAHALQAGYVVESCSLKSGNIESGEAPKVVLGLIPPPLAAFWPRKSSA